MATVHRKQRLDKKTGEIHEEITKGYESLQIEHGELHLQVQPIQGYHRWWLETSVPRLLYGHNTVPATREDLEQVLKILEEEVTARLGPVGSPDTWRVTRLDVVRDFYGVEDRAQLLDGLAAVHVPHARQQGTRYQGVTGTESLSRGSPGRWVATLYDKHQEALSRGEQAPVGQLRFECRLRARVLVERGIRAVGDLSSAVLARVADAYFTRAGFDRQVRGRDRLLLRLGRVQLSDAERRLLPKTLGLLQLQAAGRPPPMSDGTRRKCLDLADRIGISVADFVTPGQHGVRLDLERGIAVYTDDPVPPGQAADPDGGATGEGGGVPD